ncbi:MAG: DEAD/DEAH box helicase family protein [Pirellulaceae bacterium]
MSPELRPYQQHVFEEIRNTNERLLIQQPTGSGKTLVLGAASVSMLNKSITHAIIACPQVQIEKGFVGLAERVSTAGGEVDFSGEKIRPLPRRAKTRAVLDYLDSASPGYVVATTHQTLGALTDDTLPKNLDGKLLVVDEAHHAAENVTRLGRVVSSWHKHGGRVIFTTATDFRTDGAPILIEGMRTIRRSLAEHMQDPDGPFAPPKIESEIIPIDLIKRTVTAEEVDGRRVSDKRHKRLLIERMVRKWTADGKPKTVIKIPTISGGTRELVEELKAAFAKAGARAHDATGTSSEDQKRFHEFLRREREQVKRWKDAYDVVIGIQRVIEGTDWPWCSDVFVIGIPSSIQQIVQLLGRATRLKAKNYPRKFRDRARIVFFVPTSRGSALRSLSLDHSRKMLLLTAFLADTETGESWLLEEDIRRGCLSSLADRQGDRAQQVLSTIRSELDELLDPSDVAIARLIVQDVLQSARDSGNDATVEEVLRRINSNELAATIPDDRRPDLVRIILAQSLRGMDEIGGEVSGKLKDRTSRLFRGTQENENSSFRGQLMRILAEIVNEFRDVTIPHSGSREAFERQLHCLSGKDIQSFTEKLQERYRFAMGDPIDLTELHAEIWRYYEQRGDWPSVYAGSVERFSTDYRYIDHCLRKGQRGLGPGSSLYSECKVVAADKNTPIEDRKGDSTPWTSQMVRDVIRERFERHGEFPTKSTPGTTAIGAAWSTIDYYLRQGGFHGLPGGSTLSCEVETVKESLGMNGAPLTFQNIRRAILQHRDTTGDYPSRSTKGTVPLIGGAWSTLNNRLRNKEVGRKSSLAAVVKAVLKQKKDPPKPAKAPLTRAEIHAAIRQYREVHGDAPSRQTKGNSGLGISWGHLNNLLTKGGRGLRGDSSLAKEARKALKQAG